MLCWSIGLCSNLRARTAIGAKLEPELDSLEELVASLGHLLMMRLEDLAHFQGQSKMICVIVAEHRINWPQCPLAFAPNQ